MAPTLADQSVNSLLRDVGHEKRTEVIVELGSILTHQNGQDSQVLTVPVD
jgi:hypothetical protein